MFEEFDANGSGFLDFDEFSRMLPALGIHLPPSKVVRTSGSPSLASLYLCTRARGACMRVCLVYVHVFVVVVVVVAVVVDVCACVCVCVRVCACVCVCVCASLQAKYFRQVDRCGSTAHLAD